MRKQKGVTHLTLEPTSDGEVSLTVIKNGREISTTLNPTDGAVLMKQAEIFYQAALLARRLDVMWCRKAEQIGIELS
jgi:hypothetical protein